MSRRIDALKFGVPILLSVTVVYFGFGGEIAKVSSCESTVTKYVTAEYSEVSTSIDIEGNLTTDTEYWSKQASNKNTVATLNGEVSFVSGRFEVYESNGYSYPRMPDHDISMKLDSNFDRFAFHDQRNLSVGIVTVLDGEHSSFDDPITKTKSCIDKLNSHVYIKTWYGITYSSEF
tara:strand:- start:1 stop:528 length:528 start_codon:yes stop_codon:yes gene_type:complete